MSYINILAEDASQSNSGISTIGIAAIVLFAIVILAVVMYVILKSLTKVQPRVNEKLQQKNDEVAGLRLDVEKEKLQNELNQMKAPKYFYCKYCGAKNDINATRCSKCGVGVDEYK